MSNSVEARFPLFENGPFDPLQASLQLAGTEQRQVRRRILVAVLFTWVPLVVLAAAQGCAIGPNWRQSMLLDPAMYARFLVAMPLLILATSGVRRKLQVIVCHFEAAGLVKEQDRQLFIGSIAGVLRWRDSLIAAVVIAALAIAKSATVGIFSVAEMQESWRVLGAEGHRSLSLAGWWEIAVCDTLYDIMVLQFLYRLALLWGFFWKTSRLDLRLNAAHPDGAGGLAFLGMMFPAFRLPIFAIAASSAGTVANLMLHTNASFADFRIAIGAFAASLVMVVAGPLLFFNGQLRRAKDRAVLACGALAGHQLQRFDEKWLGGSPPDAGEMLRTSDFSAVGDLNLVVMNVRKVNTLPFWWKQLVPLVIAALLPFLPVAAIEVPVKEILLRVLKMVR
jgi:hypothetical protein